MAPNEKLDDDDKVEVEQAAKVEVAAGSDETCATFAFTDEDHTMGNAVRYMLMKNPDVEFAGYSVPHPNENKMNVRVQTTGAPATEALTKALRDTQDLCKCLLSAFGDAMKAYAATHDIKLDS
eukprot:tig00000403_g325.t1